MLRSGACLAAVAGILSILLLIAPANSMKIISYSVSSEVTGPQGVHQKIALELENDGPADIGTLSISVPSDAEITSAGDTYGTIGVRYGGANESGTILDFSRPLEPNSTRLVIIELETESLIRNRGEYFEYLLVFTPKQNIIGFEQFLKLPKGARLFSPRDFSVVFPDAEVKDTEGVVSVLWRSDLVAGQPVVFLARYRMEYTDWKFVGIVAFIVIFSAGFSWLYGRKFLKKFNDKRRSSAALKSLNLLNEREKAVVEMVLKNEGIKQNDLRAALGYTKSSMSKIISRLEMRRIIERKNFGKINRLYSGEKLR